MKVKVRSRAHTVIISTDGKPPEIDSEFRQGKEKIVEFERNLIICGNPLDPWRIVVDIELLGDK